MRGTLSGLALKAGATVVFAVMAALIKLLGAFYPLGQIVFFRSAVAIPVIVGLALVQRRGLGILKTARPWAHARRSIAGTLAMFSGFAALMLIPLAEATAINFASPIFTTALAAIVLGEDVRIYRWTAVIAGFVGVLIMIGPALGGAAPSAGVFAALAGAFFSAIAMIFVRRMSGEEEAITIAFYFMLTAAAASALTLPFEWRTPDAEALFLLIAVGVLGGIGQLLLTYSYRYAEASAIAPLDYLGLLWAAVIGFAVFNEALEGRVVAGAVLVALAGLFIFWRERVLGRVQPAPRLTQL